MAEEAADFTAEEAVAAFMGVAEAVTARVAAATAAREAMAGGATAAGARLVMVGPASTVAVDTDARADTAHMGEADTVPDATARAG